MKTCDCGQRYESQAALEECQATGHAGSAEREAAAAAAWLQELGLPTELEDDGT